MYILYVYGITMSVTKGTLIVHDSTQIVGLTPGDDDDVIVFDSNEAIGVKTLSQNIIGRKYLNFSNAENTNSTSYVALYTFSYLGSFINNLESFHIISFMDSGSTSFDITVHDITNDNSIGTQNFSNTAAAINTLSSFSNVPVTDAIFEIRAKINGGDGSQKIYINNIIMIFK